MNNVFPNLNKFLINKTDHFIIIYCKYQDFVYNNSEISIFA